MVTDKDTKTPSNFLHNFRYTTNEKEDGFVDIIDGQQRLLTITILLSVIRDLAREIDQERSKLYHRKDIAIENWEGQNYYRILPSETLIKFFHDCIQDGNTDILQVKTDVPEEQRVKANYEYLYKKVKGELDRFPGLEYKLEVLASLRKKVRNLIVINVEINREEDAYEIFETTNARGMELSVADLLKNLMVDISTLWFISTPREREDVNLFLTIFGGLFSFFYFIQRQQLEELESFKELFKYFNEKYNSLNEKLNEIAKGNVEKRLTNEEIDTLYDYFNLCSEEYLYFMKGYIYPEVWRAWCNGMESFLSNKRIGDVWVKEEKNSASYYGLTRREIKRQASQKN